jgi:hypothetical protein
MNNFDYTQSPLWVYWNEFLAYLPQIIYAIIVVIIGWILGVLLGKVARRLIRYTHVDEAIDRSGLNQRLNFKRRYALLSNFMGMVVKWIIIIGALGVAADMLNIPGVNAFIAAILAYIPNVIVAVIILTVGVIAAEFVADLVATSLAAARIPVTNGTLIASIARYAIIVFSVMAALTQLRIVPQLIEIAFAGVVFALALAFGLGGRDHASDFIRKLRNGA